LLGDEVELRESFIYLRSQDTIAKFIKELSRPLKVRLRFAEVLQSGEKIAEIVFDDLLYIVYYQSAQNARGPSDSGLAPFQNTHCGFLQCPGSLKSSRTRDETALSPRV